MRLLVLSDLHLEFAPFDVPDVDADVVILAGDTDRKLRGVAWAAESFAGTPVIYVAGNHEFYGDSVPKGYEALVASPYPNVHVLEQASAEIDGVRFLGATLWTDFELLGDAVSARVEARRAMNDFRRIRVSPDFRRLRPEDTEARHARTVRWLRRELEGSHCPTVVVTHHAPSRSSVLPEFRNDFLSAAYASNLDDLVAQSGAALWVHGHTHHAVDYRLGETRVLSNPRGYAPNEMVPGFDPRRLIDVSV